MARCEQLMITEPERMRGQWRNWARELTGSSEGKVYLELGCGKGRFTVDAAESMPELLYIAIEKVPDAMVIAMERASARAVENLRFIAGDAAQLCEMFDKGEVDRIYINFCDPWPKSRDAKHRLTYPGFLRSYAELLPPGGQLHFKTDNRPLFRWSAEQLEREGWEISDMTEDLHAKGEAGFMTDYEAKFVAEGMKINRLVASRTAATLDRLAPPLERMRNASLTDARGYAESRRDNGETER